MKKTGPVVPPKCKWCGGSHPLMVTCSKKPKKVIEPTCKHGVAPNKRECINCAREENAKVNDLLKRVEKSGLVHEYKCKVARGGKCNCLIKEVMDYLKGLE